MEHIIIAFCVFFGFYFLFILSNIFSFLYSKQSTELQESSSLSVSVIVAIRNGSSSLENLIKDLLNQDYSGELDFVLVDDESSDNTKEIIQKFESEYSQIKYISSTQGNSNLKFKKKALDVGIQNSNGEILLFTDVDCRVTPSWVSSMVRCFNSADYVIGFSRAKSGMGFANLFQRVDFLMLMFSANAVSNLKFPLACSGQNQGYRRSLFNKVKGYEKISSLLMGDDSIFLQQCLKHQARVTFCEDAGSYVFCRPEKTWKSLLLQRVRWAGDGNIMWKFNPIFYFIMISTVLSNFFILFLIISCSLYILPVIALIKFLSELILAVLGASKFKEKISIFDFTYWYIFNIPYVCIMSISSFFVSYMKWKDKVQ